MAPVSPAPPPTARVSSASSGDCTVLTVGGVLDGAAGDALVTGVTDAVATGASRVEIDLCGVDAFDVAGADALLTCKNLTNQLAGGLHYRTRGGGAGQEALLQAYADPHASDGSAASSEAWEPAS